MIIGVSGKKQHGKDRVHRALVWFDLNGGEIGDIEKAKAFIMSDEKVTSYWKNVKFADKLKDIICLLTGCTREQLETEEFKNSYMSDEWNKTVYGSYCSNGGLNIQTEETYAHNPGFSHIIYDIPDDEELTKRSQDFIAFFNDKRDFFDSSDYRDRKYAISIRRTYRDALQEIGTNLFRRQFCGSTWVNATMAEYNNRADNYPPMWVVTDVRFPNEAQVIKDNGGLVVRVNRPSVVSTDTHESETALDNYTDFDAVFINDNPEEYIVAIFNFYKSVICHKLKTSNK